jgi:hypothetical protein
MLSDSHPPIARIARTKFYFAVLGLGCLLGLLQRLSLLITIPAFVCALFLPAAMDRWSSAPRGRLLSVCVYLTSLAAYMSGLLCIFFLCCEYFPGLMPCNSGYRNSVLALNLFFGGGGGVIIVAVMSWASKSSNEKETDVSQ